MPRVVKDTHVPNWKHECVDSEQWRAPQVTNKEEVFQFLRCFPVWAVLNLPLLGLLAAVLRKKCLPLCASYTLYRPMTWVFRKNTITEFSHFSFHLSNLSYLCLLDLFQSHGFQPLFNCCYIRLYILKYINITWLVLFAYNFRNDWIIDSF